MINKIAPLAIDIFMLKTFPAITGMLAFMFGGSFIASLLVGLIIKIILNYFDKEIKLFAKWLRAKIHVLKKRK